MSHVRAAQRWGTPQATPAPHVEVEPEFEPEAIAEISLAVRKLVSQNYSRFQ
jgi:hypothetical protein